MENKALNLLSLARKGGNLGLGEEAVGAAARAQRARLIVVAGDCSDHSLRRVKGFVAGTRQPWLQIKTTKDALGDALGITSCAMAVITDVQLALAFVKALGEDEKNADLLADLQDRTERVKKRRQEEKAHQNNIRHGKKRTK